jgi:RNA polymerase sigma-70 factor, ECF subfamily
MIRILPFALPKYTANKNDGITWKLFGNHWRTNVSFAAISHTQRTSSTLFFRSFSTVPTSKGAGHRGCSFLPVEKTEAGLALVCRGGVAEVDITDEAETAVGNNLERGKARAHEFFPGEPVERILHLFPKVNAAEVEDESGQQGFSSDSHEQILALYKEYRPRLFAYIRSLYLGRDEAEDVIQETFLRLTNKLLQKVSIENVQGWIVHVAHDLAVDVIRRRDRDADRFRQTADFEFESVQDRTSTPAETLLEKEQQKEIEAALSRFTAQQRQCFHLRAEGFRYKDIGLALGISEQRAALIVKQVIVRLAAICG